MIHKLWLHLQIASQNNEIHYAGETFQWGTRTSAQHVCRQNTLKSTLKRAVDCINDKIYRVKTSNLFSSPNSIAFESIT